MAEAAAGKTIGRDKITDATAALFTDSVKIPERFIRTNKVLASGAVVGEDETFELPVVDMASLLDPELSALETAKLGSACRDWGFFQLTNHGIKEAAIQQMKGSAAGFFSLPLETKNTVAVAGGGFEGFGHHFNQASSDKLDWADQEALIGAFFGGDDDDGAGKGQSMSMHHYPPCRWHRDRVVGITPHTDTLGLTLLLQVDDTPGLQIKRGGRWFPVRPLPGAVVVNVGDILDVLTNGAYASVEHRVVPDAERGRVTVAMFHEACVQGQVAPLPELLAGGEVARYRSTGKLEFMKGSARALAQGRRFLDSLKM
ncbi:Thebaine 6-O-demethylase [Dichanthelium oligosanthes]|uniref:Thebaine 6-O-demethylase n=1 Tax=Dichanthelium oligosanthes TaxID=888268 RepID=A0A1E5WBN7_9POAL|nr:Thebaine 6-O-demethylase [Dichanthelium oligosanthes]